MDWTQILDWLLKHGIRILIIVVIALVLYFLLRHFIPIIVRRTVEGTMKDHPETAITKRANTLNIIFIDIGIVIIAAISVFMILSEIGVNVGPALAGLGVLGVAVGFGAQSLIKDLFNGILILLENQFGVGDVVKIAGVIGTVEDLTLRRTVLRDLDGIVHSVPNGDIDIASNYTKEWSRVNLNISVGYGEDLDRVIEVINRVGADLSKDPEWAPMILKAPQVLRVDELGDSGIDIKILGETKPLCQWGVKGELRLRLKRAFDAEGIEIPWPHMKVFFGDLLSTESSEQIKSILARNSTETGKK